VLPVAAVQARRPSRPRPEHRRELLWLVGTVGVAGGALVAAAVVSTAAELRPVSAYLFLVLFSCALTDLTAIDVRFRRQVESFTWAELNVVLGLALLPVDHLMLTTAGIGIAYLVAGQAPLKWVLNTGSYAVGLALAAAVTYSVAAPTWERPAASAVALVAGAATWAVWNKLTIDAAIALAVGERFAQVVRSGWVSSVVVFVCNVGLALACLAAARAHPVLIGAAPLFVVVAALVNRWYLRLVQDRATWRHLEGAARELVAVQEDPLADAALRRAAALMQADAAELRLRDASQDIRYTFEDGRTTRTRTPRADLPADLTVQVVRDSSEEHRTVETTVASVPLGTEERVGSLTVRYDAAVRLTRRERSQLLTYAGTLAVAVANARLHARVLAHAEQHEYAALHDHLTGLPNRTLLLRRVQAALDQGRAVALLVVDLDRFKPVNDRHGHAAGDTVLRATAGRMTAAVRPTDTVARIGGDEFAVLVTDTVSVHTTTDRLQTVLDAPVDVGPATVTVGGSIGVATAPTDGTTVDELLSAADRAMYLQKRARSAPRGDTPLHIVPNPRATG
jgi:diguanylate cyclase